MQRSFHAVIMRRSLLFVLTIVAFALAMAATSTAQNLNVTLPMKNGSVKFGVIGDTGTGDKHQEAVAKQLTESRAKFPFDFVIMNGDNLYGGNSAKDYDKKFALPYKPLLDGGVKFYASLGNHDDPSERFYKPFNMNGERYYSFKPANSSVRFFALDSNYMDDKQVKWLDDQLAASGLREVRRQRRLHGPRALLRAHQAAEGDRVLHRRQLGEAARGQHRGVGSRGEGIRPGLYVHAGRDRRG